MAYLFPKLALDSVEWTASRPDLFIFLTTHCLGGWLYSRLGVDTLEEKIKFLPLSGIKQRSVDRKDLSIVTIPT
jgi:hypothetical protein